jgi:hypothetical protein
MGDGRKDGKKGRFCLRDLCFWFFFDTNEGSSGKATKWFIREYDFLIMEGWMDGVQSGKSTSPFIKF